MSTTDGNHNGKSPWNIYHLVSSAVYGRVYSKHFGHLNVSSSYVWNSIWNATCYSFHCYEFLSDSPAEAQVTAVLLALAIGLGPAWAKGLLIPANEAHRGCAHRAPESSDKNIVRTYGGFLK